MIEVIADLILKHSKKIGINEAEAFLQKKNIRRVDISQGFIKQLSEQEKSGFAVRSLVNKHMGFVSSNSSANIEDVVELSAQNAKSSIQKINDNFNDRKFVSPVEKIRDDQLRDLSLEEMGDRIVEILKSIETSKPIKKIDGSVSVEIEERIIANTSGIWKREIGTRMQVSIETAIQVGNFIGVGSSFLASRELESNWQELFNSAIKTAYSQQNRERLTLEKPKGVILSSKVLAQILAFSLIPSFYESNENQQYESIQTKSFMKGIEMIDDPTYPGAQNTFGFDDEAYPSKPRTIVSNGKCKRLLGMNFTCLESHPRTSSQGNCYRVTNMSLENRSYLYPPTISASNFIFKSKKNSVKNPISELQNGIYIKDISGAQDSNYFSGDFTISSTEGYEIKDGEIIKPILPCFCSGNIFKILEDQTLLLGTQIQEIPIPATPLSVITPSILTTRMTISC
ncbi:MAG: TldD/PmbA family protein [Candidatus Heimdallarchaeota archaeon]|nr:TldD/PmbA family protein [Candidatus Heimdallarchaeota archaeon]